MTDKLTSNLEDYLEAIFFLQGEKTGARPKDISDRLGVKKASVTGALQTLSEKGLVHYTPYSSVSLTPEGFRLASKVVHRHKVLQEFLYSFLQLPQDVAEKNACRLEHHTEDEVLERLIDFIQFVQKCPRTGSDWLKAFTRKCREYGECENCDACIEHCLRAFREEKGE